MVSQPITKDSANLVIHSDNIRALEHLKESLAASVQCLIIDPEQPKAKSQQAFDQYARELDECLQLCAPLLKDSGGAFIHADDRTLVAAKTAADNAFKAANFLNMIILKTAEPSGLRSSNSLPFTQTEYLLIYAKDRSNFRYFPQFTEAEYDPCYRNVVINPDDPVSDWRIESFPRFMAHSLGFRSVRAARTELGVLFERKLAEYALAHPDAVFQSTRVNTKAGAQIKLSAKKSVQKPKRVFCVERDNAPNVYLRGGRQMTFYSNKIRTINGRKLPTKMLTNLWTDITFHGVGYEGQSPFPHGKKPERLVQRILNMCTEADDLVLDPYAGSGTTAAVAEKLGRKWIVIEQQKALVKNMIIPRLKAVVCGTDQTGLNREIETQTGGTFDYVKSVRSGLEGVDTIHG